MKTKRLVRLLIALMIVPCMAVFAACGGGHVHVFDSGWQKDEQKHWHVCECGEKQDEAHHTFGAFVQTETEHLRTCSVCLYVESENHDGENCSICGYSEAPQITSLSTFTELNDCGMYSMDYLEDYMFDEFLQTGAANDVELAEFLQNVLLDGLPVEIKAPGIGCSTFSGELAESGDRIFARNFDFSYSPSLVVKTNPDNGYKSISTVNLGFVGYSQTSLPDVNDEETLLKALVAPYIPLDGVNEKGLAVGVLQINWYPTAQSDENKINLPTTTMIRLILDKAASVDEALGLMAQYNMRDSLGANFHYQIADKSGKSVVVEYFGNEMRVVEQQEGADYHFATNFLLHQDAPAHPKGGVDRYNTLQSALSANGGVFADEQEAMDLLEAVKQNSTWWSVVYNLDELTSMFVPARQYTSPAYVFQLSA